MRHLRSRLCDTARRASGFTLIEMVVVITIIGSMLAVLLPAVQAAREGARRTVCRDNLKQFALAVANFESQHRRYPPSGLPTLPDGGGNVNPWSAQAVILPFLEQGGLHSNIDFRESYENAANVLLGGNVFARLSAARISAYVCPSEIRDHAQVNSSGVPEHYPLNYAVNLGTWFVYSPESQKGGDGAFYFDSRLAPADVRDGLSYTLLAAEVRAWQPYYRNASLFADPGIPGDPATVCSLGGQFRPDSGHTEWVDGRAHQIGFTTTFPPNTKVPCMIGGITYDVDWTNQQEGKSTSVSTFAAVTARSYHPGGVNVAMMDGSVHWAPNTIDSVVWRSLSTRSGREPAQLGQ